MKLGRIRRLASGDFSVSRGQNDQAWKEVLTLSELLVFCPSTKGLYGVDWPMRTAVSGQRSGSNVPSGRHSLAQGTLTHVPILLQRLIFCIPTPY